MTDADERLSRLAGDLVESGELSPAWRDAFLTVRRDEFIPELVWRDDGDRLVPLRRSEEPAVWLELAYADGPVVTQVDDGDPIGPDGLGRQITSSASQPGVVAMMLRELDARPGMNVCEIGTGTGYNAALLAARLGSGNVTSIEIDPQVADAARKALEIAGFSPAVVTGDGADGYPPNAPYDRLISTAAVTRVPYAWIEQTRVGGRILTPWATDYHNGALLALTVAGDGTASGRFVGNVAFMRLRAQRGGFASAEDDVYDRAAAVRTTTDLHPYHVVGDYDASLAIGIQVPSCVNLYVPGESGAYTVYFIDRRSRSWASIAYEPGGDTYPVRQLGPRRLWDEVAAAYRWWDERGRPDAGRWGITVRPEGQDIWLDTPSQVIHTTA